MNEPQHKPGADEIDLRRTFRRSSERRRYVCRQCEREEFGTRIPDGWYWITRAMPRERSQSSTSKLGMFCRIECLVQHLPRIVGIDRHIAARIQPRPNLNDPAYWKRVDEEKP